MVTTNLRDMSLKFPERECIGKLMLLLAQFVLPINGFILITGDGKLETDIMPIEETILIMDIMDRVREIGGLKYPEQIEAV
jgi:hypothetical protein